ncbi:MAG: RagB/SusD family nutrient uptake outer membrane protein, partial [Chlamydiia bacterium]|nr:RagB/SusD family nutrient uptake outer membrane protein [Chlamydiia bacterium]
DAVVDLPLKSAMGNENIGRATKGAALALLVKISATQASPGYSGQDFYDPSKYNDAKKYAEQLFGLGEYNLYLGDYADIFSQNGEDGSGSIFEVQFYNTSKAASHPKNNNGNFNTFLMMPWFGGGAPYGKYMVTYDLYTAFEDGDPRREASLYNVYEHADAWDGTGGVQGKHVKAAHASFVNRKHWMNKETFDVVIKDSPVNDRLMRLSDIYLLYAEACLNVGGDALSYINKVRSRARGAGTIPADLTSVTLDDVYNERRVELCNEGQRRHDLVRLGLLEKELKTDGYIATATTTPDGSGGYTYTPGDVFKAVNLIPSTHIFFPIPLSEVDKTNSQISQNPGY